MLKTERDVSDEGDYREEVQRSELNVLRKGRVRLRLMAECLNLHRLLTLADVAEKLKAWRRYFSKERLHGAIGNKVPIMLTKSGGFTSASP